MNKYLKFLISVQAKLEVIEDLLYSTNFDLKTKRLTQTGIECEVEDMCNYISHMRLKLTEFIDVLEKEEIKKIEEKNQ